MKKCLLFVSVLLIVAACFYLKNMDSSSTEHSNEISGAFEALNFLGSSKTFPFDKLPEQSHYAAWESWKKKNSNQTAAKIVDPWESMGPHNKAGRILAIAYNPLNPRTLYAGSASGGLWKSTTAGEGANAWERVPIEFPVLGVSTIAIDPNDSLNILIGTGEVYNYQGAGGGAAYRNIRGSYGMGILKTTDGGATWMKSLDWSYNQQRGIWAVKFAPFSSRIIYAATTIGVFKSENAGETWEQIHDVIMANDLIINPTNADEIIVACGNLGSSGRGIYRSTDAGASWTKTTSSALPSDFNGKIQFGGSASQQETIYASIGNGFSSNDAASWLVRSDDFGETWELKSTEDFSQWQGWFAHDVAVFNDDPDEIIVLGVNNYKSTNGGENLNFLTSGGIGFDNPPIGGPDGGPDFVHSDAHDLIILPGTNTVFIASDGGVHASYDRGANWVSRHGSLQTMQFYNGFSNSHQDSTVCMGGLQDNGTIMWNGDKTWTLVNGGDGSWSAINPLDDQNVFASSQYLNTRRSTNQGQNFSSMNIPSVAPHAFIAPFVMASDGKSMYAGSSGVAFSPNGGLLWLDTSPLNSGSVLSMDVSSQNPFVAYVATAPSNSPSEVFQTIDRGGTWRNVTQDLPNRYPMDLTVDPTDDKIAYIAYGGFGGGHVYKTEDYGNNWTDISEGLPDVPTNAVAVDPLFPNNIYVGNDLGIFFSPDGGITWEDYNEGLAEATMIFDLKISPANRKLRAATHGNGAFQRFLAEVDDMTSVENLKIESLENLSVFPNPLLNEGTLKFELSEKENLSIRVVDISGKELKMIFEGERVAGEHQLRFDASEFSGGVYFIQIQSGNGVETVKFLKK